MSLRWNISARSTREPETRAALIRSGLAHHNDCARLPNVTCPRHGVSPGTIICVHLWEHGGDYAAGPQDGEGYPEMVCPKCFEGLKYEQEGGMCLIPWTMILMTTCFNCVRIDLLPKLGKCIYGEPVK